MHDSVYDFIYLLQTGVQVTQFSIQVRGQPMGHASQIWKHLGNPNDRHVTKRGLITGNAIAAADSHRIKTHVPNKLIFMETELILTGNR